MALICIPKPAAEKMKEAVRTGEISIKTLYEMSSGQRRTLFEKYSSGELAQKINSAFERAMISKQKLALKKWAESTFSQKDKEKPSYKRVLDKINDLEKLGVLNNQNNESFLSDLVAEKLGVTVTASEVQTLTEKAKKLEESYMTKTEDGLPPDNYWKELRGMNDYIISLAPSHKLRVATSIIGRGMMLFSVKSPLVNIISNTVQGFVQGLARRISSNTYKGLNGKFSLEYVKKVNKIYQESGYDISRMESISAPRLVRGEEITHSEGPGGVRRVGRWFEDVVFKQLMGAPDVAASSVAFADSADLASTKIAQEEKLTGEKAKARALEIFKDAILIKPTTVEGEFVRGQAIADARYSTYTQKGGYSDFAMAIRAALNKISGDVRLGDQLMPFVKTPANVIETGINMTGVGFFKGFYKLPEAIRQAKEGNRQPMNKVIGDFVQAGLGLTLSVILAFMFDPDDFVGDYDSLSQKERDLARLKGAPFNSIRIGTKYISMDYFGPLAPSIVGIMYARKYGDSLPEDIFQYTRGAGGQVLRLPGLREFVDLYDGIKNAVERGDIKKTSEGLFDEAVGYVRARTVPALVNDFAKATDRFERATGGEALSKLKAGIPGLRQTLPPIISQVTGEEVESEGFFSILLFGGRLGTAEQNEVVKEIGRLSRTGNVPAISNIEYSSSRMKTLREQIGDDKFQEALKFFGKEYGEKAKRVIGGGKYKKADDEGKKKELNSARDDALEKTLKRFHYKKPKK